MRLARLTIHGEHGYGHVNARHLNREAAAALLGQPLAEMFTGEGQLKPRFRSIEFPLLDWLGRIAGKPVYALISDREEPFEVPVYDTSLYFDELHLNDEADAVRWMQDEVRQGKDRGHTNFKIKVGRGAMHMPLAAGIRRDISVIRGVREAAGPGRLMIDANNGYNLNITKEVLQETKETQLFWVEEAFHEDPVLYSHLKQWIAEEGMSVQIADGEGVAAPPLVDWAKEGVLDIVQYDLRQYGFFRWLELGRELDAANVSAAPHNYGGSYGNYASCHIAGAIDRFVMVEWDEARTEGVDDTAFNIASGKVKVPNVPGMGLQFDKAYYERQVKETGWSV